MHGGGGWKIRTLVSVSAGYSDDIDHFILREQVRIFTVHVDRLPEHSLDDKQLI